MADGRWQIWRIGSKYRIEDEYRSIFTTNISIMSGSEYMIGAAGMDGVRTKMRMRKRKRMRMRMRWRNFST